MNTVRQRLTIKRGETFRYAGSLYHALDDGAQGAAVDLHTEVGLITSSVRQQQGIFTAVLAVAKHATEAGRYDVTGDTTAWPETALEWDVRYVLADGTVVITDTILVQVRPAVTPA